jgi:hypothetical protein
VCVCVCVALVIQHAIRMRNIVTVPRPILQYFSALSHKQYDFFFKKLLKIKCVFLCFPQLLFEIFFILKRNERDMIEHVYRSSFKIPVILVRF